MLNGIWAGMLLTGIVYAAFTGDIASITEAALDSSKEAVALSITMLGVMAFWCGMMEIASQAGIVAAAAVKMRGITRILFPGIPKDHPAQRHITTNMVANVLGLGWAATPAGIRAMEEMGKLSRERGGSNLNDMYNFLILNISSLQLIPVNVIAYRSQYGSVNPAAIIGAGIIATAVSTGIAVLFCLIENKKWQYSKYS